MRAFRHRFSGRAARARLPHLLGASLAALLPAASLAATDADRDAVREQLSRDWYYTEVIIFHRPAVLDFLSEEALTTAAGAAFPVTLRSLVAPEPGGAENGPLWSEDPRCLEFPGMDARDLAASEAAARAEDGARPDSSAADAAGEPLPPDAEPAAPSEPEDAAEGGIPAPAPRPQLAYDPLLAYLNTVAEFEDALEARSLTLLEPDRLILAGDAARIDADRRFQVLWHGGWLQAIPAREAPVPLLIQTGHRWGQVHQLEGTIDVTLGRYLHFHTQLLYHEPLIGDAPVDQPVPPPDAGSEPLAQGDAAAAAARAVPVDVASALQPGQPRFMVLEESRRMRSSELHYLDHPKLGVLVRIEPVELPDSLVEAYLALEESPE